MRGMKVSSDFFGIPFAFFTLLFGSNLIRAVTIGELDFPEISRASRVFFFVQYVFSNLPDFPVLFFFPRNM